MDVIAGNCVGGGSVVYFAASLRAPSFVFERRGTLGRRLWPAASTRRTLDRYYERVERVLPVAQQGWDDVSYAGGLWAAACAHACPTKSIQFGPLDELRDRAARRVDELRDANVDGVRLYGDDPTDGVGGAGAFFLLLDKPEVYGLPPDPVDTTRDLPKMWAVAARSPLAPYRAAE